MAQPERSQSFSFVRAYDPKWATALNSVIGIMNLPPYGHQMAKIFLIVSASFFAISVLNVGTSIQVAADKNPDANPEANTADTGNTVRSDWSDIVFQVFVLKNNYYNSLNNDVKS